MSSQRAHKQPPASQGISCAPTWSGGTEHLSLPALIPPQDGQGWQSFICSHSQLAEPLAEPLLSSSLVNPWGSSELKATLWHLPVPLQTPLSCTQAPALRSCSKAAALPSDSFFFCTPFGSRCNLPPY